MPRSIKMAEIKRILKIKESNRDFSNRQIGKIVICYVIEREFCAFNSVRDPSPKYVFSLDEYDMSKDGITHFNIEEWLLNKVDVTLS